MTVVPSGMGGTQPPSSLPPVVPELPVQTPSAQIIYVLGVEEQDFYNTQSHRYQTEYAYTNVSDLLDLDQLLFLELQMFRLSKWLGTGKDYDQLEIDHAASRRALKETAELISKVKTNLGMTKSQRDKEKAESVSAYLTTLKQRAREFGVLREKQLIKTLALQQQLFSIVGSFDRADEIEREKLGFPDEHAILEWVRNTMRPEYDALDAYFRANQQRYWLKDI